MTDDRTNYERVLDDAIDAERRAAIEADGGEASEPSALLSDKAVEYLRTLHGMADLLMEDPRLVNYLAKGNHALSLNIWPSAKDIPMLIELLSPLRVDLSPAGPKLSRHVGEHRIVIWPSGDAYEVLPIQPKRRFTPEIEAAIAAQEETHASTGD